jgi:ribonucleotide reductase alpha subunit
VVRSCTQNGVRGGSATVHFPIWHKEIEDILVLKNNKGTEDNRVRKLDYSIQLSKLFYERLIVDGDIYQYVGVSDSIVRERLFEKLAETLNVGYDYVYNLWLN